jgi:uncharacterized protein YtpQ (UPF0354 family)
LPHPSHYVQYRSVNIELNIALAMGAACGGWRMRPTNKVNLRRRAMIAGAAALAISPIRSFAAADDLADGRFRDEVVELLHRLRPDLPVETTDSPVALRIRQNLVYLVNLHQAVSGASAEARKAKVLSFVDAMAAGDDSNDKTFEAVRNRLRARIVTAAAAANSAEEKIRILSRPFSAKARIAYVIDNPHTMAYVAHGKLEQWGVGADAVHAASIANLDTISKDVPIDAKTPPSGSGYFAVLQNFDDYAAARLLAPKFMERMGEALGPEYFVAIPVRSALAAWSVDCSARVQIAAHAREVATTQAYAITDELFVWSSDGIRLANAAELADHGRG